jgi:hypothetical protein
VCDAAAPIVARRWVTDEIQLHAPKPMMSATIAAVV